MWLVALSARQQFFFQESPERVEMLELCFVAVQKLKHFAVIATKRIEARVSRDEIAHRLLILPEPRRQCSDAFNHPLVSISLGLASVSCVESR